MKNLTMPLLESRLGLWPKEEGTVVLHINHSMDNSFYFSSQLRRAFHDVIFVAVPYSGKAAPPDFDCVSYHAEATEAGYRLYRSGVLLATEATDFMGATRALITQALENELRLYAEAGKRIIIIEDGGYHYDVIDACIARHPVLREAILGAVEQTTSGTKRSCDSHSGAYPVLSVSRSKYKIRFEAYFVANRVVDGLVRLLHEINDFPDFKRVLLLGYGIIGRSVAEGLAGRNVRICVEDPEPRILDTAVRDGYARWEGDFSEHMMVIGNSGRPSFTRDMLEAFLASGARRLLLASSSSKQTEFAAILPFLQTECHSETCGHSTVYTTADGHEIVLLADGFPLNFVEETCDSLTFDMIDPVFTEIFLLALYLQENRQSLEARTYLLGVDASLNAAVDEATLIRDWARLNGLAADTWDFNVHPNESELADVR